MITAIARRNIMEILVYKKFDEASDKAFEFFKEALATGPKTFGLATGSTPEALYQRLVDSDLDFSDSISVNLDEYFGLSDDHKKSYHHFMQEHLFQHKPFKASYLPDGSQEDVAFEINRYNQILKDNPIDLQILGIGSNAHIGFNEPGAPFDGQTQLVDLTQSTIEANKRFFNSIEEVPTKAYSMGIASIMAAKKIILMAYGTKKAQAIHDLVLGEVTPDVPASILQRHPDVTLLLDEEAASLLDL